MKLLNQNLRGKTKPKLDDNPKLVDTRWFRTSVTGGDQFLVVLQDAAAETTETSPGQEGETGRPDSGPEMGPTESMKAGPAKEDPKAKSDLGGTMKDMADTLYTLVVLAQNIRDNRAGFQRLVLDTSNLYANFYVSYIQSHNKDTWERRHENDLVHLRSCLTDMRDFAASRTENPRQARVANIDWDLNKIKEIRMRLATATSTIEVRQLVGFELLRVLKEQSQASAMETKETKEGQEETEQKEGENKFNVRKLLTRTFSGLSLETGSGDERKEIKEKEARKEGNQKERERDEPEAKRRWDRIKKKLDDEGLPDQQRQNDEAPKSPTRPSSKVVDQMKEAAKTRRAARSQNVKSSQAPSAQVMGAAEASSGTQTPSKGHFPKAS